MGPTLGPVPFFSIQPVIQILGLAQYPAKLQCYSVSDISGARGRCCFFDSTSDNTCGGFDGKNQLSNTTELPHNSVQRCHYLALQSGPPGWRA